VAQPLTASLPPDLALYAGCSVRVIALDPTTGATVTGVRLANVSLYIQNVGEGALQDFAEGEWSLVPGPGA
jgi:hypothetical protein